MPRKTTVDPASRREAPPFDIRRTTPMYGVLWPHVYGGADPKKLQIVPITRLEIELECCRRALDGPGPRVKDGKYLFGGPIPGSLGFRAHFINLTTLLFGASNGFWYFQWHENAQRMLDGFLGYRRLGILGHMSSGKTRWMACMAVGLFFVYGKHIKVYATTVTKLSGGNKIWGGITKAWQQLQLIVGERMSGGKWNQGDDRIRFEYDGLQDEQAGIELVATEQSSNKKSSGAVQGSKAEGGFLVVLADELDELKESLITTFQSNLTSNRLARFVGAFNPSSRFSVGGRFVTPLNGWGDNINEEVDEWELHGGDGLALRFDGMKSPNVLAVQRGEVPRGTEKYPGLLVIETIERVENEHHGGKNSPEYWKQVRAWFSPVGVATTIYDENEIIAYRANLREDRWVGIPTYIGGFDTAWAQGGDKCVLVIGKVGPSQVSLKAFDPVTKTFVTRDEDIKTVEVVKVVVMGHNLKLAKTREEQIVVQLAEVLAQEEYGTPLGGMLSDGSTMRCNPLRIENIAVDITGGAPVAPLIRRDLGEFMAVNFKSSPSDKPVSRTDTRLGTERFANKRAEMWWCPRELIRCQQIRGIPGEVSRQLCALGYSTERGKIQVEDKAEAKKRLEESPDEADGFVLMVDVARQKFGLSSQEKTRAAVRAGWGVHQGVAPDGKPVTFAVKIVDEEAVLRERFAKRDGWERSAGNLVVMPFGSSVFG